LRPGACARDSKLAWRKGRMSDTLGNSIIDFALQPDT
jgi:hypothetical protein